MKETLSAGTQGPALTFERLDKIIRSVTATSFAQKACNSYSKEGFCTKSKAFAQKACAVVLCLFFLVSVVEGRANLPITAGGGNTEAKFSSMVLFEDVVIGNHPIDIVHLSLLSIIRGWDKGGGRI